MSRAEIRVTPAGGHSYRVVVAQQGSETTHLVTVPPDAAARLGGDGSALVAASFRFLLDREPKESILKTFELPIIAHYFPEYPERIGEYLSDPDA